MLRVACLVVNTLVFVAVAFACGGTQRPTVPDDPAIQIIDAGAEPRSPLRLELTAGRPERMELTQKLRINVAETNTVLESGLRSVDLPSIVRVLRFDVTAIDADGIAVVSSVVEDVKVLDDFVDPKVRAAAQLEANAMKGEKSSWRITPTGRISIIPTPSNLRARLGPHVASVASTVRDNHVLFPGHPLGVGARWTVVSQHVVSGVTWERTTTYWLKALTDSTATVDAQTSTRANSQALSVEPNASTRLTSATAEATAEIVIPLHGTVATMTSRATGEFNFLVVRRHLRLVTSITAETFSSMRPINVSR